MKSPFEMIPEDSSPVGRARLALEGLSVGDAFGQRFFVSPSVVESLIESRALPGEPWYWTDSRRPSGVASLGSDPRATAP